MPAKECPLCGGSMRLTERTLVDRIPGNPKATTTTVKEWICPDCDYFEEAEDEK
jgi:transposase